MQLKWFGATLIIAGCGGFGFKLAASHRREMFFLQQLILGIQYMECELQYRLTPLPQLCRQIAAGIKGGIHRIFLILAEELEHQTHPDAQCCMDLALAMCDDLPPKVKDILRQLGISLGKFDLPGQIQGMEAVRCLCAEHLEQLRKGADIRLRGYQTLGLCAGAALAILFV